MSQTRFGNDTLFGLFLCGVGALGLHLISDLRLGTAMRMGPGYVPMLMAWACVGFGALLIGRGILRPGARPEGWAVRPLATILASVGAFMAVPVIGLIAAVMLVTLVASLGDSQTRWLQAVALAAGLAVFCALVFVRGLGLSFPLWPSFLV